MLVDEEEVEVEVEVEVDVVLDDGGGGFDTWEVVAEVTTRDIKDGPGPPAMKLANRVESGNSK